MEILKRCKFMRNDIEENSIGLTDERVSEHFIRFSNKLYGSLALIKDVEKPTLKINNLYLVEPKLKSEEFCILQFSLARGNNSGGTFDMSNYLFRNSDYIVLTKVELYSASTYEWSGVLITDTERFGFGGGTTILKKELKKSDNVRLEVPVHADFWRARFYGYVINPVWLGKDIELKQENWHNLVKG